MTLVKENKKATTLSIGDGANDVGMIKGGEGGGGGEWEGKDCVVTSAVWRGGGEWGARSVWSPVPWGGVGGKDCVVTSALYV